MPANRKCLKTKRTRAKRAPVANFFAQKRATIASGIFAPPTKSTTIMPMIRTMNCITKGLGDAGLNFASLATEGRVSHAARTIRQTAGGSRQPAGSTGEKCAFAGLTARSDNEGIRNAVKARRLRLFFDHAGENCGYSSALLRAFYLAESLLGLRRQLPGLA